MGDVRIGVPAPSRFPGLWPAGKNNCAVPSLMSVPDYAVLGLLEGRYRPVDGLIRRLSVASVDARLTTLHVFAGDLYYYPESIEFAEPREVNFFRHVTDG